MDFSYRFLQGRGGAEGHAVRRAEGQRLQARGLPPGAECILYQWQGEGARPIARGKTEASGQILFSALPDGPLFLALAGRPVLWEADGAETGYFRAWDFLRRAQQRERKREKIRRDVQEEKQEQPSAAQAAADEAAEETGDEALKVSADEASQDAKDEAVEETGNEALAAVDERTEVAGEGYALRAPAAAPGTDELPAWVFPGRAAALAPYFRACPPIQPFPAPGWHFVRAPSPLPGVAYCALGFLPREDRAEKIAYAVPGGPYRPPAPLPGYRYHEGFWLLILDAEEAGTGDGTRIILRGNHF